MSARHDRGASRAPRGPTEAIGARKARPRGRTRFDPGISAWLWTLIVICLAVMTWLLPSFSASGESCCRTLADLPRAHHGRDLEVGPTLRVLRSGPPSIDGQTLDDEEALSRALVTQRELHASLHGADTFTGALMIEADRRVPWGRLRPLLAIAAREGYARPQFLVDVD